MQHALTLRRIGYVQSAPACGDCAHSDGHAPDLVCGKFGVEVQDSGRCLRWQPSPAWLRANPEVARQYQQQPLHAPSLSGSPLSTAEWPYLRRDHALRS